MECGHPYGDLEHQSDDNKLSGILCGMMLAIDRVLNQYACQVVNDAVSCDMQQCIGVCVMLVTGEIDIPTPWWT